MNRDIEINAQLQGAKIQRLETQLLERTNSIEQDKQMHDLEERIKLELEKIIKKVDSQLQEVKPAALDNNSREEDEKESTQKCTEKIDQSEINRRIATLE